MYKDFRKHTADGYRIAYCVLRKQMPDTQYALRATHEVVDGLALARIPAAVGVIAADYRGIYLDIATTAAICGALFQPFFSARSAAAPIALAAPSAVCPVLARAGEPGDRTRAPGGDCECAHWADDRHSRNGCLAEHVCDRYRAQPLTGRRGCRAVVH